jgi:hypothetical protein
LNYFNYIKDMKEGKKNYEMVYYYESRGIVGERERVEVSLDKDEIVEFIWNFMNEYYDGEYEESLISWLDEKWGRKRNYDKFLRSGMEKKDGCVVYEVYEEEYIMLIENGKDDEEKKVLELVGNLK